MTKKLRALVLIVLPLVLQFGCRQASEVAESARPPVAEKITKELKIHGDVRLDKYYWLRERKNPRVIAYLEAENVYKDAVMAHTKALQDNLYTEIVGRIKQTDMSVPFRKGGYFYQTRYEEGKEYPVYCRKKGSLEAEEEIMLDVNRLAEGHDYFHVIGPWVSPGNDFIAYGVDTVSRRKYTLHFKNLETGAVYEDEIDNTTGMAAWANDNKTVFYAEKDDTLRAYKIKKHVLGTDGTEDPLVFHEDDVTFEVYVFKSKSDKYIFIVSNSTLATEYRFLDADTPKGAFRIIQPRERGLEYYVEHFGDKFYIRTNFQAKNFKLMAASVDKTEKTDWIDVVPHREDVFVENFEIFKNFLVISERKNGLMEIRVIRWDNGDDHYLDFDEEAYFSYVETNPEFDTDILRFGYTSLTTPNSIYDYNMNTKKKELLKREVVLGDFDPVNYHVERLTAAAKDGVKVPISLVYRKGLERNGRNPLLLYGYGSYGYSTDPTFSSEYLSLLDRGFVYAIAHIRGGSEMGRSWYEDGKLLKKKNTFTDFIACAEHLIAEKFTDNDRLFAAGGSAGGLLMGAVVNLRPDLFKGIIASVPFVDVVTTMLDPSIPLTTSEYDEWGNPENKEYYDYMLSYSPYDNVEAVEYPPMLVTTGLHDSQVQYWEPAKWVAKLREMKTDDNMLLLHTNMEAGHGGVSGRFRRYRETALEYAFLLELAGVSR
ncbi:MAG: S9 family peptidase [Candidatus Aminicenantes bacterium]|nr:S9 family peptidase [Candidatus Aminicenantes bacterium]